MRVNNEVMAKVRDVQLSSEFLQSSIARSIIQQNSNLALLCLEQGEKLDIVCKKTGRTLIHLVAMEATPMTEDKYVPLVYVLSNAGLQLDTKDHSGITALQLSIKCSLLEIMTSLLKCGANLEGNEEELAECHAGLFSSEFISTLRKLTPGYWHAVEHNKTFKVNKLVKSWCRVNISRDGQSLIEYAKRCNADPKLVAHLVQSEASIELAHATIAGDIDRMNFLLCNQDVDLATSDLSHRANYFEPYSPLTLYGAAIKYGHKHLLPLLKGKVRRNSKQMDVLGSSQIQGREQTASSVICSIL